MVAGEAGGPVDVAPILPPPVLLAPVVPAPVLPNAPIFGTAASDRIDGGVGADVIDGRGGNDTIFSGDTYLEEGPAA